MTIKDLNKGQTILKEIEQLKKLCAKASDFASYLKQIGNANTELPLSLREAGVAIIVRKRIAVELAESSIRDYKLSIKELEKEFAAL